MGDDGYGTVNLNFAFPYYDKTFNQAYMYDNGVLSFLQPGTPDALPQWQWNSQPLSQTQAKYFIAPLWADIAPVSQTQYLVDNQLTSAKFTWSNIAEYYSRGGILRLNTFSVEINANGDIATKYFGLNLRTSNISIGYKGYNDYNQIAYNPYGYVLSNQTDWTANTKQVTPAPTPIPVKQEPVPEPVVEQPVQEVIQPIQTVTTVASTTPTATVQSSPVASVSQPIAVSEPSKTTETKKIAVKAQSVDMSVVDAAVSIAMTSAAQSVNEQVVVSNNFSMSNSSSVVLQRNTTQATQRQTIEQVDNTQQTNNNNDKKDALELFVLNSLDRQDTRQDQKDKGVNKNVVTSVELGQQPPLVDFLVLQDAIFYAPKAIYRNQKVVDNQRLLRSLSNDKKYTEMIDGQYR